MAGCHPWAICSPKTPTSPLLQVRDQLRFLALLADPRGRDEPDLSLRPGALAECIWRVASQLDGVAEATVWTRKGTITPK